MTTVAARKLTFEAFHRLPEVHIAMNWSTANWRPWRRQVIAMGRPRSGWAAPWTSAWVMIL